MNINELYESMRSGSPAAEDTLFQKMSEIFRLFLQQRIWNKDDVEEVLQETLMTVAKKHRGIEFESSFAAWAYRVLENKILDYYRAKGSHEVRFAVMSDSQEGLAPENPDPMLKKRLLDCLRKICGINIRHARILNLRYQGFTVEEICNKLGVNTNNLYILLSRARTMLRLCLEKEIIR